MDTQATTPECERIHVGCSGWHYQHWRGPFYPSTLAPGRWLDYYSRAFDTVELNASFYRMPRETTVGHWCDVVPPGFLFAVKGSRIVTHVMRLKSAGEAAAALCERASGLGPHFGPVLWQLPPSLQRDDARLETFVLSLPGSARHVIEFRHHSWWHPDVYSLLARHRVAVCLVDMPDFRSPALATADFIYVRFHGATELYGGSYETSALIDWAAALRDAAGTSRSVYAYFNNDSDANAVRNALEFRRLLASP